MTTQRSSSGVWEETMELLFIVTFLKKKRKTELYFLMHKFILVSSQGACVSQSCIYHLGGLVKEDETFLHKGIDSGLLPSLFAFTTLCLLPFPYAQLSGFMGCVILNDGIFTIPKRCQGPWTSIAGSLDIFC